MGLNIVAFCCIILILILLFLYYKIRLPFVKQVNEIPGPDGIPFLGVASYLYFLPSNKRAEKFREWFASYGPVFRTWLGPVCFIHVAGAEQAQKILSSMVNIEKPYMYSFARPWLGECLEITSSDKWFERRNLLTPAFHVTALNGFLDTILKNCQIFTKRLEKEVVDSNEFDIFPYITDCSMDIIAETAMNVKLNVQNGLSTQYPECVRQFSILVFKRFLNPLVHFDFLYSLTSDYRKMKKVIAELRKVSTKVVNERIAYRKEQNSLSKEIKVGSKDEFTFNRKEKQPVLDTLLDIYDKGNSSLTLEAIREEVDDILFGGYDAVNVAMAMTIYLIGLHPEVQDKIHAEVDSVIPFEDSPIDTQTLAKLKYLDCTLKESMRLYSPAPIIARCLKESVILDNHTVPVGTTVVIHLHAIHRSPDIYPNPDKFDPSNFFPEREKDLHPFAFIPFSAGPRNCLGQKFAKMEAKIALALFFKKFEVKSMTKVEDMTTFIDIIMKPEHGVIVKIKRRL